MIFIDLLEILEVILASNKSLALVMSQLVSIITYLRQLVLKVLSISAEDTLVEHICRFLSKLDCVHLGTLMAMECFIALVALH